MRFLSFSDNARLAVWGLAPSRSPHRGANHEGCNDRGMLTAETAVVIPVLVLLLYLLLGVIGQAVDQTQTVDAARSAARLVARGEPTDEVAHDVAAEAPDGSSFDIVRIGDHFEVTVTAPGQQLLGLISLPDVVASAVALDESSLNATVISQ